MMRNKRYERYGKRHETLKTVMTLTLTAAVTLGTMLCLSGFTGREIPKVQPSGYYTVITVQENDTLWDLARTYCGTDYESIKQVIKDIMQVNSLKNSRIFPGQRIAVPYHPGKR